MSDPRHEKRRKIVQELFASTFTKQKISQRVSTIIKKTEELDTIIQKAAPQWPIDKINKIDLVILRLAIFELLEKKEPLKVIIDEAVELAKEFGGENSPSFVNGVLGTVVKDLENEN